MPKKKKKRNYEKKMRNLNTTPLSINAVKTAGIGRVTSRMPVYVVMGHKMQSIEDHNSLESGPISAILEASMIENAAISDSEKAGGGKDHLKAEGKNAKE